MRVFSVCPLDEDPPCIFVSYDRCGLAEITPEKQFEEKGKLLTSEEGVGRVAYKRYAKGDCLYLASKESNMYSFSKSSTDKHCRLTNCLSGSADMYIETVTSEESLTTNRKREFTVKVGAHRAFDVDDKEQFFVVVEEAKLPDTWRKVLLYQQASEDPVATYTPPTPAFQPSDVCFYTLGHQHVLFVSDELCEAIHVVHVQDGVMTFLCYLAPGCPSLIQPTAMNVDVSGRLWVACRGGHIITMEQKTGNRRSVCVRARVCVCVCMRERDGGTDYNLRSKHHAIKTAHPSYSIFTSFRFLNGSNTKLPVCVTVLLMAPLAFSFLNYCSCTALPAPSVLHHTHAYSNSDVSPAKLMAFAFSLTSVLTSETNLPRDVRHSTTLPSFKKHTRDILYPLSISVE